MTPGGVGQRTPVLEPNGVHVWHAGLDVTRETLDRMAATLAEDETARAARFRYDLHRDRYIAGRGILRALLGRYLDCEPRQITFRYGRRGKPFVDATPIRFNASHSASEAVYVFALGREVGVDIEGSRERKDLLKIAEHFFAQGEVAALSALPEEAQREAFYRCWTRKEAYLKAKGDGLSLGLDQFEVTLAPGDAARLTRAEGEPGEPARWDMVSLDLVDGYASALVVESPCGPVQVLEWPNSA